jgi:hypothetical protein
MRSIPATPVSEPVTTPGTGPSRRAPRVEYQIEATLVPDTTDTPAGVRTLYVRDVSARSVGFIVGTRVEPGRAALVSFALPDGSRFEARCFVRRCRSFAPRWYEGLLMFERVSQCGFTSSMACLVCRELARGRRNTASKLAAKRDVPENALARNPLTGGAQTA